MAGLGRRTFAAGEVLTASNVMGYLQDQAVMSFAGTAARGSAIGTAASEGMVSYLKDSDTVEIYDGSSWIRQTAGLIPIKPSSVVPVGSGSSASTNELGLVTFSSCSSLQLAGIFNSRFRNYKIVIDGQTASAGTFGYTYVRVGNGTTFITSGYIGGFNGIESGYTATTNVADAQSFPLTYVRDSNAFSSEVTVCTPYASLPTKFYSASKGYAPGNAGYTAHGTSLLSNSDSYSAMVFLLTAGSMSGTIQIFGYNN